MNIGLLNKYCDKVLRALDKVESNSPVRYEINELQHPNILTEKEDFFKRLKISEEYIFYIIEHLTAKRLIKVFGSGGGITSFDHENNRQLQQTIYTVQIERAGKVFIQSSSLWFESVKERILKWMPLTFSGIAILLSVIIPLYLNNNSAEKLQELKEKQTGLYNRIDSLVSVFPQPQVKDTSRINTSSAGGKK